MEEKIQPALDAITELAVHDNEGAVHAAFLLLHYSASRKFAYLQRMVAPTVMHPVSVGYDKRVRACLSRIVNPHQGLLELLDDEEVDRAGVIEQNVRANAPEFFGNESRDLAWRQATIPVRLGGMGLDCAELNSHAAFVAAWADFLVFMEDKPDLFPMVRPAISEGALDFTLARSSSRELPIKQLETSWNALQVQLKRRAYGALSEDIPGKIVLCGVFGDQVKGLAHLGKGKTKRQHALTSAMWDSYVTNMRLGSDREQWFVIDVDDDDSQCYLNYESMTDDDQVRFTSASGPEAGWISQVPTRKQYRLTPTEWRTAVSYRLRVPIGFLRLGPRTCTCHRAFADNSRNIEHQRRGVGYNGRARNPPGPVDMFGCHDQNCKNAAPIIRHNKVQTALLHPTVLKKKGCVSRIADVATLRRDSDRGGKRTSTSTYPRDLSPKRIEAKL